MPDRTSSISSSTTAISSSGGSTPARTVIKVAVIGTGLAGLVSAYRLATSNSGSVEFEVHLFDESPVIGFDASSISVTDSDGVERRVDVPMRSFAGGYYTRVIALYRSLGLQFHNAKFSYSFSEVSNDVKSERGAETYYMHGGQKQLIKKSGRPVEKGRVAYYASLVAVLFWYIYFTLVAAFSRPKGGLTFENEARLDHSRRARYWYMTDPDDVLNERSGGSGFKSRNLFRKENIYGSMETGDEDEVMIGTGVETLREYVARWHFPRWFVDRFMTPLFCAMSTCTVDTIMDAPAADVIDYKRTTFMKPHYLLSKNSRSAVDALTACLNPDNIHLGMAVKSMLSEGSTWTIRTGDRDYNHFVHVIIATPPSVARELHPPLEKIFKDVKSEYVRVLVHTDSRVLDYMNPKDIRDLNLIRTADRAEATHVLFPGVYQTTSPTTLCSYPDQPESADFGGRIAPEKIVKESRFERVVRSAELVQAIEKMRKHQGRHNVWVTGSWMWQGLVLLEGCVASADYVTERIKTKSGKTTISSRDIV
ncbi:hypothetical protein BZA70DRAFT_73735 [Myxozyma melibiosi]|uniref:Amine oxidase domain-containing protein n=1 Tax=Myxozyma melibiosi TaxID=54550 RepID=A0ABR1F092_9ASCO